MPSPQPVNPLNQHIFNCLSSTIADHVTENGELIPEGYEPAIGAVKTQLMVEMGVPSDHLDKIADFAVYAVRRRADQLVTMRDDIRAINYPEDII